MEVRLSTHEFAKDDSQKNSEILQVWVIMKQKFPNLKPHFLQPLFEGRLVTGTHGPLLRAMSTS